LWRAHSAAFGRPVQEEVSRFVELRREHVVEAAIRAAHLSREHLAAAVDESGNAVVPSLEQHDAEAFVPGWDDERPGMCKQGFAHLVGDVPERKNPRVRRNLHLCRTSEHERYVRTCRGILLEVL